MEITINLDENNNHAKALVKYLKTLSFVSIKKEKKTTKNIELVENSISISEARALTNKHINDLTDIKRLNKL